jgi:hypothetical protein
MSLVPILAVAAAIAAPAPQDRAEAVVRGRALTQLLLAADADALAPQLAPAFLQAIGGPAGLALFAGQIAAQAGAEQEVLREAAFEEGGNWSYYRVSRFASLADVTTLWVIGPDGLVAAASVRPTPAPAPSVHEDYRTRAPLRLPFGAPANGGAWYVAWGGRDAVHNYHVVAADQRFAYDFLVARGGRLFAGDGARNEDHFCWDEPVLAPAAGRVVRALGDIPDNPRPGARTPNVTPPGNHVVIDHGGGEFSLIAHFQAGSLAVREGEAVAAGQLLGRCGNSGNSSAPHVHYHLQTGPAYGEGVGLPAVFNAYRADGEAISSGEPVRGQRLLPGG